MRHVLWFIAAMAIMLIAKVASAAPSCEWELNKADQAAITVTQGDVVVVTVTTPARGNMRAPAGWESQFKAQDACPGYPVGCGTWVSTKSAVTADSGNATFTVEGAQCANNARTFNVLVNAKPEVTPLPPPDPNAAKITQSEWDEYKSRRSSYAGEGNVEVAAGFATIQNSEETTRWGRGFQLSAGGKPVRSNSGIVGLKLDATFRIWSTGAPVDPGLYPTTMDVDMLVHSEEFRMFLDITPLYWLQFDLGAGLGVMTESWGQELARQEPNGGRVIMAENKTETVGTINPTAQATVIFGQYVGARAEAFWVQPMAARMDMAGSDHRTAKGFVGGAFSLVGQF
jgi:hypothetical protein